VVERVLFPVWSYGGIAGSYRNSDHSRTSLLPPYLIMGAAAVSFFAAWCIKETYRMSLA